MFRRRMSRRWIAELLTLLLIPIAPLPLHAQALTVQAQLVLLPAGSVIEVRTHAKQKLRGRLGALASDSFEIQTTNGSRIRTQSLRFDEVQSVRLERAHKKRSVAAKVGIGVLIAVGVLAVVIGVTCATHSCAMRPA